MATRKLKVYGGNLDGRHRVIMAAASFAEFKRATGITRNYGGPTDNAEECAAALAEPGVLFVACTHNYRAMPSLRRMGPPPVAYSFLRTIDLEQQE